jgi:hypothetical protein
MARVAVTPLAWRLPFRVRMPQQPLAEKRSQLGRPAALSGGPTRYRDSAKCPLGTSGGAIDSLLQGHGRSHGRPRDGDLNPGTSPFGKSGSRR